MALPPLLLAPSGKKWCNDCGKIKPVKQFNVDKTRPDGLNPACKQCVRRRYKNRGRRGANIQLFNPPTAPAPLIEPVIIDPSWYGSRQIEQPSSDTTERWLNIAAYTSLRRLAHASDVRLAYVSVNGLWLPSNDIPLYGANPLFTGFAGGRVCKRCCNWFVNSFFDLEDSTLCTPCYRESIGIENAAKVATFSDSDSGEPFGPIDIFTLPSRSFLNPVPTQPIPQPELPPMPTQVNVTNRIRALRLTTNPNLIKKILAGLSVNQLLDLAEELDANDALREQLVELAVAIGLDND